MTLRELMKGAGIKRWVDRCTGKRYNQEKIDDSRRTTQYYRPKKRVTSKTPMSVVDVSASEKREQIIGNKNLRRPLGKSERTSSSKSGNKSKS